MSNSPVLDSDGASISKFDEETVLIKFKDGANVLLNEAIEIRDKSLELFPEKKFLALIDATGIFGTIAPDAMSFFARDKELTKRRMAQAIVVDNLPIKILANFYLRVKKPAREAVIFSKIDDAKIWLAERKHLVEN